MSYAEAKNHFETGRLNTVDKGVIETIDERKHSCEEITVTTPLNHKVKVRMKNLGDDVWDTTLVYVRQPHRVGTRNTSSNQESDRNRRCAALSRSGHLRGR